MNNKKDNYSIKSYQKKRIQTPRETSNYNENDIIILLYIIILEINLDY